MMLSTNAMMISQSASALPLAGTAPSKASVES
jgi:hypothetical protein